MSRTSYTVLVAGLLALSVGTSHAGGPRITSCPDGHPSDPLFIVCECGLIPTATERRACYDRNAIPLESSRMFPFSRALQLGRNGATAEMFEAIMIYWGREGVLEALGFDPNEPLGILE